MVKVSGVQAHIAHLKGISGPELIADVDRALFVGGNMIQVDAQISITEGAVSGKGHVPSLPGQPPKNDTGHLANNIETAQVGPLKVQVSSNAGPKAAALELGTSKMAARPYMRPAAQKNRKKVQDLVAQAVSRVVARTKRTGPA